MTAHTPQTFAAEVDRQILEYGCVSDDAIGNVRDDLQFNHGMSVEDVQHLAIDHFQYRTVRS